MAQHSAGTDLCRDQGIFEELHEEVHSLRCPVATTYVRPLMTPEQLSTVQRQITDLFHGCDVCKKVGFSGQFATRFGRSEGLETELVAQILSCLGRWDGGSLEGVPQELKPRYRQTVKRQLAKLLDTSLKNSSAELGETTRGEQLCVPEFPSVSKLVQAWNSPLKHSTPALHKGGEQEPIRTSVSRARVRASEGGSRGEPEDNNQPVMTDSVLDKLRREPELFKEKSTTTVDIVERSLGCEPESKLPVSVDIVRATGSPERKPQNFKRQQIMKSIARTIAFFKEKTSAPKSGSTDDSCSDNESCSSNYCFCIWKSKTLRNLMRRVFPKATNRKRIPLPAPQVHTVSHTAMTDSAVKGAGHWCQLETAAHAGMPKVEET